MRCGAYTSPLPEIGLALYFRRSFYFYHDSRSPRVVIAMKRLLYHAATSSPLPRIPHQFLHTSSAISLPDICHEESRTASPSQAMTCGTEIAVVRFAPYCDHGLPRRLPIVLQTLMTQIMTEVMAFHRARRTLLTRTVCHGSRSTFEVIKPTFFLLTALSNITSSATESMVSAERRPPKSL